MVLDIGCGSHSHTLVEGLSRSRRLAEGEIDLRVSNWEKVVALSIGTYEFILPSENVLSLDNCYYVPALSRNIISISCLDKCGFLFSIKNNSCSIYRDDLFYGISYGTCGLYVLDLQTLIFKINIRKLKLQNQILLTCGTVVLAI